MTTTQETRQVHGYLTEIDGVECYRIDGVDRMDPFLMSIVSSSDLWMFASSRGTLTAGRIDADHAFLPYETDDRIHRSVGITGPVTVVARTVDGRRELWRPFGAQRSDSCPRSLAKSLLGNRLILEETNQDWGVTFRSTWLPSPNFGWVRRVELRDVSGSSSELEIVDGLLDVMPPSVDAGLEQIRSNLVDAYKRSETGPWGSAALYSLESLISDRAEPGEALSATVIWSESEPDFDVHVDERMLEAMVENRPFTTVNLLTGRRGAYLLRGRTRVEAGQATSWTVVADVGLSHAEVTERLLLAGSPDAADRIDEDTSRGLARLAALLTHADGYQTTGDPIADAHHLSNVMFNVMRGGLFPLGQAIPMAGFLDHMRRWNRQVFDEHAAAMRQLGESVDVHRLLSEALDRSDPHLTRLVLEYLPLAFSRRHGDPSRPWNRFSINVRGDDGREVLGYEGNWRDIFQNWEALLLSHPSFVPNVVAKFVNASTVDGHNPYRITHEGVDWEVPDPHDPWSNIGYWGDHQIVYLHRLVELWERVAPGDIGSWLSRPVFVYADVPYIIANHAEMIRDPRNTITFDEAREAVVEDRVARIGSDGRLVTDASGQIIQVGLLEKLLVPALAKLTAFVPGGGVWMNTQRPEWNDANNALAGYGLSMVTLYHLYGYLTWLKSTLEKELPRKATVSASVAAWMTRLAEVFTQFGESCHTDDRQRREMMDALGLVGDRFRHATPAEFDASQVEVTGAGIDRLLVTALDHLRCAIEGSRRADGLYDSYNVVGFPAGGEAIVDRLGPMLEGQVAALSSGFLDGEESLAVIEALFASGMYRPDQNTFMLYPDVDLPAFTDRNRVAVDGIVDPPVLEILTGPAGIMERDRQGGLHFAPAMVNGAAVATRLEMTELDGEQKAQILGLYESVFGHHRYTGRSGSMYGYEGIGSVYWHMVGKLLVATQEAYRRADERHESSETVEALADAYRRIRAGLGFCKSPVEYGAIPTDCYSHTPGHAGAQQPGMTGHVKELIITRFGELGLHLAGGRVSLAPGLLDRGQLLAGESERAELTFCGTRFLITAGEHDHVTVRRRDGQDVSLAGLTLTVEDTVDVLQRSGAIESVEFTLSSAV